MLCVKSEKSEKKILSNYVFTTEKILSGEKKYIMCELVRAHKICENIWTFFSRECSHT